MIRQLVLATRNPGKVRELQELCGPGLELMTLERFPGAPEVEEDGQTFADNARKKARSLSAFTGLPALADDSGLSVDALGGAPGVRSARYGPGTDGDRVHKLLQAMTRVSDPKRDAHFTCALCLALTPSSTVEVEGHLHGRIAASPSGSGGFGYDPIFLLPDGRTLAELASGEKNALSHRGVALEQLRPHLRDLAVRSDLPGSSAVG